MERIAKETNLSVSLPAMTPSRAVSRAFCLTKKQGSGTFASLLLFSKS
jgi:hypothetical protein